MEENLKQLLLKDLCARLPYEVMVYHPDYTEPQNLDTVFTFNAWVDGGIQCGVDDVGEYPHTLTDCRPYLRPMSSMTEEEIHEFQEILGHGTEVGYGFVDIIDSSVHTFSFLELQALFDWLNAHHFDFHNLIERGLAIEVTEENNPYKK